MSRFRTAHVSASPWAATEHGLLGHWDTPGTESALFTPVRGAGGSEVEAGRASGSWRASPDRICQMQPAH